MSLCDDASLNNADVCNVRITEALDSRGSTSSHFGKEQSWELHFYLQGTNDECLVRKRLEPGQPYGLPAQFPLTAYAEMGGNLSSQPLTDYTVSNIGWQLWEIKARYGWTGAVDRSVYTVVLPTQISMSTRGGNTKLSSSLRTLASYPQEEDQGGNPGGMAELPAPDFSNAIEWDGRSIKGVQVPFPITRYNEVWIFPRDRIWGTVNTVEWQQNGYGDPRGTATSWAGGRMAVWSDYTGCVHGPVWQKPRNVDKSLKSDAELQEDENYKTQVQYSTVSSNFRGWAPGEVMLDDVTLRQVGLHHFEVSFDFLVKSNPGAIMLPGTVEDYQSKTRPVDAWDHVWTYNEQRSVTAHQEDAQKAYQMNAPTPEFLYVERIVERRDFSYLDIGMGSFSGVMPSQCDVSADLMYIWDGVCNSHPRRGE